MVKMDITKIDFGSNSFDVIICNRVLEHVTDDRKAIDELFRILKPGGWAIIQAPIDFNREITYENDDITHPEERLKEFGQSDHVRIYGLDYSRRLRESGFTVDVIDFIKDISKEDVFKYGLIEDEKIHLCRKL